MSPDSYANTTACARPPASILARLPDVSAHRRFAEVQGGSDVGLLTDVGTSNPAQVISALIILGGLLGGMGWPLLGLPGRMIWRRRVHPAA